MCSLFTRPLGRRAAAGKRGLSLGESRTGDSMGLSSNANPDSAGTTNRSLFVVTQITKGVGTREIYVQDLSDREVGNGDVAGTITERPCSGGSASSGFGVPLIRWKVTSISTSDNDFSLKEILIRSRTGWRVFDLKTGMASRSIQLKRLYAGSLGTV